MAALLGCCRENLGTRRSGSGEADHIHPWVGDELSSDLAIALCMQMEGVWQGMIFEHKVMTYCVRTAALSVIFNFAEAQHESSAHLDEPNQSWMI